MIKNYSVRTDLALEEKERFESDHVEISGVVLEAVESINVAKGGIDTPLA